MSHSLLSDLLSRPWDAVELPQLALPAPADALQRPASFSVFIVEGVSPAVVHTWLQHSGWVLAEQAPLKAPFAELVARTAHQKKLGRRRWEVLKATWPAAGCTVLLDPEMVIFTDEPKVGALCAQHHTRAFAVLWERVSRTLVATQFNAQGVERQSMFVGGALTRQRGGGFPNMHGEDPQELFTVLRNAGLAVEELLGGAPEATVLLLLEG